MKPEDENAQELHKRLEKLTSEIATQRKIARGEAEGEDEAHVQSTGQAMSLGFRVLSEFVAGIIVGALIGWQCDVWLDTTPFGLIVFLTLGTAAGMWNVYQLAAKTTTR